MIQGTIRIDYEGMKMGIIGLICAHDWQDFFGAAFKGTMGMITVFIALEVQLFEHILKYF